MTVSAFLWTIRLQTAPHYGLPAEARNSLKMISLCPKVDSYVKQYVRAIRVQSPFVIDWNQDRQDA